MRAWLVVLVLGMAILPQPLVAASRDFVPALQAQGQRGQPRGSEQHEPREMRRERRAAPERDERPRHRLTDDERRELRRDIDQAREMYRRDRRR